MSNRRIVSMAEGARAQREQRSATAQDLKKLAQISELEERKVRDISRTPSGQLLKERYQLKFDRTLNEWLAGDASDAMVAVTTHARLNEIRGFLAAITPIEREEHDEDE